MVSAVAGGTYLYFNAHSNISGDHTNALKVENNTALEADVNQLLLIRQENSKISEQLNSVMINNTNLISTLNPVSNQKLISFLENQNIRAYNLSKTALYLSDLANSTVQNIYIFGIQNNNSSVIFQMNYNVSSISNLNTEVYIQYNVLMSYESHLVTLSKVPYRTTFIESGLPEGSNWSVSINGATYYSSNESLEIDELFGYYCYYANSSNPNLFRGVSGNVTLSENLTVSVNFTPIEQHVTSVVLHISYPDGIPVLIAYNGTQTDNLTLPGFYFMPGFVYNYTFNLLERSSALYIYNLSLRNQTDFALLNTEPSLPWQVQNGAGASTYFSFRVSINTTLSLYGNVLNFYLNADFYPGYT